MNTLRLWMYRMVVRLLPETRCFGFKVALLRWCGAYVGRDVRICSSATIIGNSKLVVGDDVWIGAGVFISATGGATIEIGNHVDIAPRVMILTGSHEIDPHGTHIAGRGTSASVRIGSGCWLGASCIILPGVELPEKNLVAVGSVVTHSILGTNRLVAGLPAVVKKEY